MKALPVRFGCTSLFAPNCQALQLASTFQPSLLYITF
uniref:Uncharacterized protein n=1 Tax=Aegilops tauschii subsp. strangulata TaxID=200361 RepID=A0A453S8A2_AEGTS